MDNKCNHKKQQVVSVVSVVGGQNKIIRCNRCQKRWEVPLNAEEKHLWKERTKKENKHIKDMHSISLAFHKAFYDGRTWKYSGYKMLQHVEKFAKKHPEVVLLSCDDSYNAGSGIVLIPHRTQEEYWGTTMVIIPQCTGEPPLEMFLYPGHSLAFEKALHAFNQESRKKQKTAKKKYYWPTP